MKICVVGLGSIGNRYAKILSDHGYETIAFRIKKHNDNLLKIPEVYSLEDVRKEKPSVAFICNLTSKHIETALDFADMGVDLFIEKPIDSASGDLNKLISLVNAKNLTTYVAYNLRFHPLLIELKNIVKNNQPVCARIVCTSYLPDWRPNRNHKDIYSSSRSAGGGVILDLSHELDYIQFIFGSIRDISGRYGRDTEITIDAEDYVDYLIETRENLKVSVHINYFSHHTQRTIEIDFKDFSITADVVNSDIRFFRNSKQYDHIKFNIDKDFAYVEQVKYFFANRGNLKIMNNLEEASHLFFKILEFKNKYAK